MKLPWVSREAFELMREARDDAKASVVALCKEIDALRNPPQPTTPEPLPPKPLSPVGQVIREQAMDGSRVNQSLLAHLHTYATQLKREGKTEDEIVGALVLWQTSEADGWADTGGLD